MENFKVDFYDKFIRVVKWRACKHQNKERHLEYKDLVQEGSIHLMNLAKTHGHLPQDEFAKLLSQHLFFRFGSMYNLKKCKKNDSTAAHLVIDFTDLQEDYSLLEKIQNTYIKELVKALKDVVSNDAYMFLYEYFIDTKMYSMVLGESERRRKELLTRGKTIPQHLPTFDKAFSFIRGFKIKDINAMKVEIKNALFSNTEIFRQFGNLSRANQLYFIEPIKRAVRQISMEEAGAYKILYKTQVEVVA